MCVCVCLFSAGIALMVPLGIFIPLYICAALGGLCSGLFRNKFCKKEGRNDARSDEEDSSPNSSFLGRFFGVGIQGASSTDALRRFVQCDNMPIRTPAYAHSLLLIVNC